MLRRGKFSSMGRRGKGGKPRHRGGGDNKAGKDKAYRLREILAA